MSGCRQLPASRAHPREPFQLPAREVPSWFGRRQGSRVFIEGADARHLAGPLRARPGEVVQVIDPAGFALSVRLTSVGRAVVVGEVEAERAHRPEPERRVWLGVAMLPAASLELVLSRCTEAGAAGFLLVEGERSVARGAKPERWATICREAAMLAGRLLVPEVRGPSPFSEAFEVAVNPWLLERGAARRVGEPEGEELTLFVGPEGGWTAAELALAGERLLDLGPRNLRADTAALVGLALALD